jgi:hypothetical protein
MVLVLVYVFPQKYDLSTSAMLLHQGMVPPLVTLPPLVYGVWFLRQCMVPPVVYGSPGSLWSPPVYGSPSSVWFPRQFVVSNH